MTLQTADYAWTHLLEYVATSGRTVRPRGLACREILSNTSVIDMSKPIVTTRPKLGYRFLAAEAWWIITGKNDVESIRPYSPHIASFSNDGIRFDGAYGPRIVDQLRYVCDCLENDDESRQAVVEIWRPNPRPSKDLPCTISAQWMIRKDGENYRLHCFDTMRSSDTWLGWPYDCANFSMLSAYIALIIRNRTKHTINPLKNLHLGRLHITAASQHLYVHPKQDGATNIPYSLEDVEKVLSNPPAAQEYAPINLDEFQDPQDFVDHLSLIKDNKDSGHSWLKEFIPTKP